MYELEIESLAPHRVVDKLRREGIGVLSARRTQKNVVAVGVEGKDRKKVFAILRNSCYNIKNVRARGVSRALALLRTGIGFLVGALLVLPAIAFAESRVLRVEVEGSGAYLSREIDGILETAGVRFFSPMPEFSSLAAAVLALPRVCFCSMGAEGGVLTVRVEVAEEISPPAEGSLVSPVTGTVEEIVVLCGTALVSVGDEVRAGDTLVGAYALYGEEVHSVRPIARVRIGYPVCAEYAADEEGAYALAELTFGPLSEVKLTPVEGGYRIEGKAYAEVSANFR